MYKYTCTGQIAALEITSPVPRIRFFWTFNSQLISQRATSFVFYILLLLLLECYRDCHQSHFAHAGRLSIHPRIQARILLPRQPRLAHLLRYQSGRPRESVTQLLRTWTCLAFFKPLPKPGARHVLKAQLLATAAQTKWGSVLLNASECSLHQPGRVLVVRSPVLHLRRHPLPKGLRLQKREHRNPMVL